MGLEIIAFHRIAFEGMDVFSMSLDDANVSGCAAQTDEFQENVSRALFHFLLGKEPGEPVPKIPYRLKSHPTLWHTKTVPLSRLVKEQAC